MSCYMPSFLLGQMLRTRLGAGRTRHAAPGPIHPVHWILPSMGVGLSPFLGIRVLKHIFKRKRKQAKPGEGPSSTTPLPRPPCGQSLLSVSLKGAHSESASLPRHCLATVVSTQAAFVQATASGRRGMDCKPGSPHSSPRAPETSFPIKKRPTGKGWAPLSSLAV